MINNRLIWIVEKRNFIPDYQMGFRKLRSTVNQMVSLEGAIQDSFAIRKHLVTVFFDLEKAYDTTWRYGILKKMHEWGFRGQLPFFVKNFLEECYFRVRIDNTLSNQFVMENGVPQGSTLSVNLFTSLTYIREV